MTEGGFSRRSGPFSGPQSVTGIGPTSLSWARHLESVSTEGQIMGILGIENRTENWCTARELSPLVKNPATRIALASHLVGSGEQIGGHIEFELFWRGMRDHIHQEKPRKGCYEDLVLKYYRGCFPRLREEIEGFDGFQKLKPKNYADNDKWKQELYSNLRRTEVDIVLQTQKQLCIGEAKCEQALGANSERVLVHQLIRQYVMAKILVELTDSKKRVVPFVVGDCWDELMETAQVKFMIEMNYLSERNVLSWKKLSKILETD